MEATPILYHLSPSTGRANKCRAPQSCPAGVAVEDHYPSKATVRSPGPPQGEKAFAERRASSLKAAEATGAWAKGPAATLEDGEPPLEELLKLKAAGGDYFAGGIGGDIECEDCGETEGVRKRKDYYEEYAKGNDVWRDLCEDCAANLEEM